MEATGLLLRDVELLGGRRGDVRVAHGAVVELGSLQRMPNEPVIDGGGAALSMGLVDHHLHLLAMAAAAHAVNLRGLTGDEGVAQARAILRAAGPDTSGWIRAVGFGGRPEDLTLDELDRLQPTVPLRVQHRSGALWLLNSAALGATGLNDAPDGRLWRADDRLAERLPAAPPPDLVSLGGQLAGYGITSVTDATADLPERSRRLLVEAVSDGRLPQRLLLLGAESGADLPERVSVGPLKIVPSDHESPDFEWLRERIRFARSQDRAVAVHCVTREALAVTIAAIDEVGSHPRDRIEHASLIDPAGLDALRRLGLTVVTQPGFIADRGDDYRRELPGELDDLYRVASLGRAKIPVVCSSDAPYGPADPWVVMQAAADRRTPEGEIVGAFERIPVMRALRGYLSAPRRPGGPPRRIGIGAPADLVLMHAPWAQVLSAPSRALVRSTIYGGIVYTKS